MYSDRQEQTIRNIFKCDIIPIYKKYYFISNPQIKQTNMHHLINAKQYNTKHNHLLLSYTINS